jgi:FAD/FMN-containing dehydrogenase
MTASALKDSITGTVVLPGDEGWDAARLFHSGIGEPDVIVRAADVDDVRAAVAHAAAGGSPIGVRGGGHSVWGTIPGGVLIDLAALDGVRVHDGEPDAPTRVVSVGGGATWGAVAAALAEHGLGVSSGDTASVGVGGLTLGGGIGWMVRAWGLAVDQLVGAQVVTADGEVVESSAEQHPDLFWALRGGGGNFGVVTRFDFAAHRLPSVVFTSFRLGAHARPAAMLRTLRDVLRDAPRALTVTYMDVPPMDPSAPPGATVSAVWIGDDADAARASLAPVAELPGMELIASGVRPYRDILLEMPGYDPEHPPPGFVGGNALFVDLDDAAIEALAAFRAARPASVLFLRSLGGAFGDVAQDDTPFPGRGATWFAMAGAFRVPGALDGQEVARAETEWAAIEALGAGGYGNFFNTTDVEWARRMYPEKAWSRLAGVKRRYDPDNLFRFNYNVPPA